MRAVFATVLVILFAFGQVMQVSAMSEEELAKKDAIQLAKDAFAAQVSLTEKERSLSEIQSILSSYFTAEFIEQYTEEVVVKGETQYIVYGTDAPALTIPFFEYSESFEFGRKDGKKILYQFFPEVKEGPVSYPDHYEGVIFGKDPDGWKVEDIYFSTEEPILDKEEREEPIQKEKRDEIIDSQHVFPIFTFAPTYWVLKNMLFIN